MNFTNAARYLVAVASTNAMPSWNAEMVHPETLSNLIGDIYDASLDPSRWRPVLISICKFVNSDFGILISEDAASSKAHVHYTSKDDPEWLDSYFRKYIYLNPMLVPALLQLKVGDIFSVSTFTTFKAYRASAFYKEWVSQRGYLDTIGAILAKTPTSMSFLSAVRHADQGVVDSKARQRMKLIVPHVQRAVTIGRVLDLNQLVAAGLSDTLDGFSAGIFLVDARARIVHSNRSGRGLLETGDPIYESGDHLAANNATADKALMDAFIAAAAGDVAVGTKGLSIALPAKDGNHHVAHVLPLTSGARRKAGAIYGATAVVFVRPIALDRPSPLELLLQHYKLTARELSVLLAIVEVGGVPAVSSLLGISQTTIKTYLRSIFEKTGSTRQADLVKIVAGFANPFAAAKSV